MEKSGDRVDMDVILIEGRRYESQILYVLYVLSIYKRDGDMF